MLVIGKKDNIVDGMAAGLFDEVGASVLWQGVNSLTAEYRTTFTDGGGWPPSALRQITNGQNGYWTQLHTTSLAYLLRFP